MPSSASSSGRAALQADAESSTRRASNACSRCQKSKIKCNEEHPCFNCVRRGVECLFDVKGPRKVIPERELESLRGQVKQLEDRLRLSEEPASSPSVAERAVNDDDYPTAGLESLVLGNRRVSEVYRPTSSTWIGYHLKNAIEAPCYDPVRSNSPEKPIYNHAALPSRRPRAVGRPDLPPHSVATGYYDAQYAYIGTIFAFLEPGVFERRLQRLYEQPPDPEDREACLACCQVLMVCAYGQLYDVNKWMSNEGPPGFSYFQQAMLFLPDIHEEGSVLFVEVLSLVGYWMQILTRRDAAFSYSGLALRMAISLGLHEEIPDHTSLTEREHRRRLWWSVYSMDRILCAKSGNPITIADDDIGVLPPSPLPDEPTNSPAIVLLHYTELSRILGKIVKSIYRRRPKKGSNIRDAVQSITTDLSNWLRDLPAYLKPEDTSTGRETTRESISIFLHYYQCINMTARPLLFNVVRKRMANAEKEIDWRLGRSPTTIRIIDLCIFAARETTYMVARAEERNLVATYGFMDGEHIFSAAIVLVMVAIALPKDQSIINAMDLSISVQKKMLRKGNENIRKHLNLLLSLRAIIPGIDPVMLVDEQTAGPPGVVLESDAVQAAENHFNARQLPQEARQALEAPDYLDDIFDMDSATVDTDMRNTEYKEFDESYRNVDVNLNPGMDFDWTIFSDPRVIDGEEDLNRVWF